MSESLSIFGLGYVGCVSAACFAAEGHEVIGVDVSEQKVALVNAGKATVVEHGIGELIADGRANGRLSATTDTRAAVHGSSVSLVCVGTPSRPNGSIDLHYIERVCEEIGAALREKPDFHVVVIRSTVLPGTLYDVVIPALERASGRTHGTHFGVCSNPEFLREGSSVKDFYEPPFTLIGADDERTRAAVTAIYDSIRAPLHVVPVRVAEFIKYSCNCFHAVKVSFANEIGSLCKAMGVDSHEVMRIFCEDHKLNISPAYLRPGFAFGGSCLPKDLRALSYKARQLDVHVPLLEATLASNDYQIQRAVDMILQTGTRRVTLLGIAFKAGTDDLRESPLVALAERLIGKGVSLAIYDRDVSEARIMGANREYLEREIPHVWQLVRPTLSEAVADGEVVVIGNSSREFRDVYDLLRDGQMVLDLARAFGPKRTDGAGYVGFSW